MGLVLFQKHKLHFIYKKIYIFTFNIIKMLSYIIKTKKQIWSIELVILLFTQQIHLNKCRQMLAHVLLTLIHLRKERAGRFLLMPHSFCSFWNNMSQYFHKLYFRSVSLTESRSGSKHWLSGSVKRYISLICSSIQRNAPSQCILRLFWILFFSHLPLTSQVLICGTLLLQSWC